MNELFVAKRLERRFGGIYALRQLDVVQFRGETLGMIGPNGSGKTSFVNAVTGHLKLNKGTINFCGVELVGKNPHSIAKTGLTRTYQAVRVFSNLSVRENLELATLVHSNTLASNFSDKHREIIDWLKIDTLLNAPCGRLTLFEQRRIELATRLMMDPQLIMLDEPVGGLSPREISDMMKLLHELKKRCSLFVIEHTMKVIRELADRVVVIIAGQKIADGAPIEILKDERVVKQYLGSSNA